MRIAVYCGSSFGSCKQYEDAARELGRYFAEHEIELVYGGGRVGLMGAIADAALEAGGSVYGVIPRHLEGKEIAHTRLTQLYVVESMHERKAKMASMADAFVALPGGAGTLEEIFEAWTWGQLGEHSKPCALYNTRGFYDPLLVMIRTMVAHEFLRSDYAEMLITADSPQDMVSSFRAYVAPKVKWT